VVGENGAFYFRHTGSKMVRQFIRSRAERAQDRKRLKVILKDVQAEVPDAGIASDQFCRLFDLAIDFREDVKPLPEAEIQKIVKIFKRHGAVAKVSNIHVNGWFGDYDKLSTCQIYLKKEFGLSEAEMKQTCAFAGDSPNDEPMFRFFPHSFAVANIQEFIDDLKFKPAYVAAEPEASGFCQIADRILLT
jgi:hydroxymethylpyrimidine pyrophosphatase-like HAD family hydrolase